MLFCTDAIIRCPVVPHDSPLFLAGDRRVTEQPGLTTLHTVFMRQHNKVAYKLSKVNPLWGDDRTYEEARKIIVAIMQHVTFTEFLPKVRCILGNWFLWLLI